MSGTQGVSEEKKINGSQDGSLDVDLNAHKNLKSHASRRKNKSELNLRYFLRSRCLLLSKSKKRVLGIMSSGMVLLNLMMFN
jgi:hypothetical protein